MVNIFPAMEHVRDAYGKITVVCRCTAETQPYRLYGTLFAQGTPTHEKMAQSLDPIKLSLYVWFKIPKEDFYIR